ncbi:hypothetical protein GCM10008960_37070 [Deinococcus sedimenti]|uniref:Uncharacterized protein n=1 Tax=Deinococcus sedimenti TaxID=1867090 RepID=A0ABQ2SA93_9DEIO|nr:hypothetical protein GCM10008960_37070 [Deinococcus sedimenti]
MSSTDAEPCHELRIAKAPVRENADLVHIKDIKHPLDFGQHGKQVSTAHLRTRMFNDAGDEWNRSTPEENGNSNQTELLEQHAGVEGQDQGVCPPSA